METEFVRKNKSIKNLERLKETVFSSASKTKKESRNMKTEYTLEEFLTFLANCSGDEAIEIIGQFQSNRFRVAGFYGSYFSQETDS